MTEEDWLQSPRYDAMYRLIRGSGGTTRKVRLYMVSCCGLESANFFDPRVVLAVQVAERCADDAKLEDLVNRLWAGLITSAHISLKRRELRSDAGRAVDGIWRLIEEVPEPPQDDDLYTSVRSAVSRAALMALRDRPRDTFTGGSGDAAEYCGRAIEHAGWLDVAEDRPRRLKQRRRQKELADLVRDVFGNPFRPVAFDPGWRTSDVTDLARGIYEDRAFDRLPLLADALMDAGCDQSEPLAHGRGGGPHVRGCWVVDLILSKDR
jgi:hypothetical protein